MKKIICKHLLVLLCLIAGTAGAVQSAVLPNIGLADANGSVITTDKLQQGTPWVLIILEANVVSSQAMLDTLKKTSYTGENAVVLVVGDLRTSGQFLKRSSVLLPNARWLTGSAGNILQGLKLAGTPTVLGIDPNQRVLWQYSGLSNPADYLTKRIRSWINTPVK